MTGDGSRETEAGSRKSEDRRQKRESRRLKFVIVARKIVDEEQVNKEISNSPYRTYTVE